MSITVVEPPTHRVSGRKPRLSDEDFQDLASAVKEGHWASDNETTPSKSAAYQRAQTAVKILGERFKLTPLKTAVVPSESNPNGEEGQGFLWRVGPYGDGEQPRRRRARPKAKDQE